MMLAICTFAYIHKRASSLSTIYVLCAILLRRLSAMQQNTGVFLVNRVCVFFSRSTKTSELSAFWCTSATRSQYCSMLHKVAIRPEEPYRTVGRDLSGQKRTKGAGNVRIMKNLKRNVQISNCLTSAKPEKDGI